jgi:hypothetical protein
VKSLRAMILRSAERSDEPYFTQQTGGLTRGITLRRMQHATGESVGRFPPGFIGQSRSQVIRRTLRICRENIAYNTLLYNSHGCCCYPNICRARTWGHVSGRRLSSPLEKAAPTSNPRNSLAWVDKGEEQPHPTGRSVKSCYQRHAGNSLRRSVRHS